MEETLEEIAAMCHQEDTGYVTTDWLKLEQQNSNGPLHCEAVDIECRNTVVAWCLQVVAFFKFSRETAEIAMSFLDRFLATAEGATARNDRHEYKLVSMVALYTAIKINEPRAIDPQMVSRLSHGAFSPRDIEAMEKLLLHALRWRVNPPTAMAFVYRLMTFIPDEALDKDSRQVAHDLARLQTELAVGKSKLFTVKASTVAYSALVNSLESLGLDDKVVSFCSHILSQALQSSLDSDLVADVQQVLYEYVDQQPANVPSQMREINSSSKPTRHGVSIEVSPRSITTV
jgi:hypothetical protein